MRYLMVATLVLSLPVEFLQAKQGKVADRLESAAVVMYEIMNTPDNSIPKDLLDRSVCVGIVPGRRNWLSFSGRATGAVCWCAGEAGTAPGVHLR